MAVRLSISPLSPSGCRQYVLPLEVHWAGRPIGLVVFTLQVFVFSKVPKGVDLEPLKKQLGDIPLLGTITLDPEVAKADLEGRSPYTGKDPQKKEIQTILNAILNSSKPTEERK